MTASKASAPDLSIPMAFLQACRPLWLEITMFLGLCANAMGPAAAAAVSAAELFIQFRLLRLFCIDARILSLQFHESLFSYTNSYSMREQIHPTSAVGGAIQLPGDKSISHRYGMLAAIAEGITKIENYSSGADCQSTLASMRALGAEVEMRNGKTCIHGLGLDGLREPAGMLDAGNSGSTIRMLSGILAAQPFVTRIGGDESLTRRPMARIMTPLAEMGARIEARDDRFPPLTIHGTKL